ncbi:2-amino-4-hydroxy-6-hydroxymethyldihydropteridine diphosphokinase [Marinicrinis lubricantis]|uniref:2-amino-4-hydroxy-6-hydroxymethyldihydropteridine diphosphokinase n=1 Tax=Marinicrinis lubricantis TaxID=2086470 RepID=A0ABW1IPW4_9BACL
MIEPQSRLHQAWIGLGSNIGDRQDYLLSALKLLHQRQGVQVVCTSSIYETAPVGYLDQSAFLNMAAQLTTNLDPEHLLRTMLEVERELGRTREIRWGPRTIDLDLIMYDNMQVEYESEHLILPHPRMLERAFVLLPLAECLKQAGHPDMRQIEQHLDHLDMTEGIEKWKTFSWPDELGHTES